MIKLTNEFHGTVAYTRGGLLSVSRVREIRRQLCGSKDCRCAQDVLGTRGRQPSPVRIEQQPDGSVIVDRPEWIKKEA